MDGVRAEFGPPRLEQRSSGWFSLDHGMDGVRAEFVVVLLRAWNGRSARGGRGDSRQSVERTDGARSSGWFSLERVMDRVRAEGGVILLRAVPRLGGGVRWVFY